MARSSKSNPRTTAGSVNRGLSSLNAHVFRTDLDELRAGGYSHITPTVRRLVRRLADELRQQRGEQPHGNWRMLPKDLEINDDL